MAGALAGFTFAPNLAALRPTITIDRCKADRATLLVGIVAPDVDTGVDRLWTSACVIDPRAPPATWGRAILAALVDRLTHEAREAVLFNGTRVDDPH